MPRIPVVTVTNDKLSDVIRLTMTATVPKYTFEGMTVLPPNDTEDDIDYTLSLYTDNRDSGLSDIVTVMSMVRWQSIVDQLNELDDCLNWHTFDEITTSVPLDVTTATMETVLLKLNELENALEIGTYGNPVRLPDNRDSLEVILQRITTVFTDIEWIEM